MYTIIHKYVLYSILLIMNTYKYVQISLVVAEIDDTRSDLDRFI